MWPWIRPLLTSGQVAQIDQIQARMDLLIAQQRQILSALALSGMTIPPLDLPSTRPRSPSPRKRDVADVVVMSRAARLARQAEARQQDLQAQIDQTQDNPLQS